MKNPHQKKTTWRDIALPVTRTLHPITRVAERVAKIAVHLKTPTVVGVTGLVAAGLNALNETLDGPMAGHVVEVFAPQGFLVEAFKNLGAEISAPREGGSQSRNLYAHLHHRWYTLDSNSCVHFCGERPDEAMFEWFKQILDPVLPNAFELSFRKGQNDGEEKVFSTLKLTRIESKQGIDIIQHTRPLLGDDGRCILLNGKPGVGKTTAAQQIARAMNLGRTVILNPSIIGMPKDGTGSSKNLHFGALHQSLTMLNPGVIIVDDIDKVSIPLGNIEALRRSAKLVILTANNGEHEDVLDGTIQRAGRIDEVFSVVAEHSERRSPFDRLSDKDWEEVKEWPASFLNEVENRLQRRPEYLRLDEIRERVHKRSRSGNQLF